METYIEREVEFHDAVIGSYSATGAVCCTAVYCMTPENQLIHLQQQAAVSAPVCRGALSVEIIKPC
jgi:hypothetical protein